MVVGGALSIAFHAGLGVLVWGGRPTSPPVVPLDAALVEVTVAEPEVAATPTPEPAEASEAAPPPVAERRAYRAPRRSRPVAALDATPALPAAPAEVDPEGEGEANDDPMEEMGPGDPLSAEAAEEASEETAPPADEIREAPLPPAPVHVSSGVARALRIYDQFPSLPEPLRNPGARYALLVDVCVSDQGVVSDVTIAQRGAAQLADVLRAAVRTWRYHPLLVNGDARPFCHVLRVDYSMN
jgi:hypothetical protein